MKKGILAAFVAALALTAEIYAQTNDTGRMETKEDFEMDDRVLEKKKGLNLMTKILITALIPLILIVVIAGVSIHSVGSVVARKLVKHEMQTASYALEMTLDSLGSGDYHSDGTNLYKGNYNLNSNNQTIDDFKKKTNVDVTVCWKKTRMVTSVIDKDGKRVTGTAISDSVYDKVMQDGKYFSDNTDIEGTEYYGYYEALKNADGSSQAIIFTGMPSSDVKAIYKKRLVNTTVFMIIIALMACALLAMVITFIVKAITKVIGHLDEVADGKLDFKISEKLLQRSDEIGNIARSVHTYGNRRILHAHCLSQPADKRLADCHDHLFSKVDVFALDTFESHASNVRSVL